MSEDIDDKLKLLWSDIVTVKYPNIKPNELNSLRITCATEWGYGAINEHAELYDKFVMMKQLKGLTHPNT